MKKNVMLIVLALMCGLFLTSCGGGGSSTGSSKLKKNDYLGNLPALYESYNAEKAGMEKRIEEEGNKLMAGGEKNYDKIQKLFDDQKVKEKEMKEKFNADVKAEMDKIVGKDIPVTFSDKLKNSGMFYYNVPSVKIAEQRGEPRLSITIVAKDDFTVPSMKAYDYNVFFRLVGKDGVVLERSASTIIPVKLERQAQTFNKGDVLIDSYVAYGFSLNRYAADRANFAGVEFISKEEYDAVQ